MTKPTREELVHLYSISQLTQAEIGKKYGTGAWKVNAWLKDYQIPKVSGKRKIGTRSPPSRQAIEYYYNCGWHNVSEVAEYFGVKRSEAARWMREYNIPVKNPNAPAPKPSKEQLEKIYNSGERTLVELSEHFNINRNVISDWMKEYNIPVIIYNESKRPSKEVLEDLHLKQGILMKDIAEILQIKRRQTVGDWFNDYSIESNGNHNKYEYLRKTSISQRQKDFLVGTLLGDGSSSNSGNISKFSAIHGPAQESYLRWKFHLMNPYSIEIKKRISKDPRLKSGESTSWRFQTCGHQDMNEIHNLFYDENDKKIISSHLKNYLTPFGMAIWFMDDGYLDKNSQTMGICSQGFTYQENLILVNIINQIFGVEGYVGRSKYDVKNDNKIIIGWQYLYHLWFNRENSMKLSEIIREHMFLPLFQYKLPQALDPIVNWVITERNEKGQVIKSVPVRKSEV